MPRKKKVTIEAEAKPLTEACTPPGEPAAATATPAKELPSRLPRHDSQYLTVISTAEVLKMSLWSILRRSGMPSRATDVLARATLFQEVMRESRWTPANKITGPSAAVLAQLDEFVNTCMEAALFLKEAKQEQAYIRTQQLLSSIVGTVYQSAVPAATEVKIHQKDIEKVYDSIQDTTEIECY